jgi:hypothetical protein
VAISGSPPVTSPLKTISPKKGIKKANPINMKFDTKKGFKKRINHRRA